MPEILRPIGWGASRRSVRILPLPPSLESKNWTLWCLVANRRPGIPLSPPNRWGRRAQVMPIMAKFHTCKLRSDNTLADKDGVRRRAGRADL